MFIFVGFPVDFGLFFLTIFFYTLLVRGTLLVYINEI